MYFCHLYQKSLISDSKLNSEVIAMCESEKQADELVALNRGFGRVMNATSLPKDWLQSKINDSIERTRSDRKDKLILFINNHYPRINYKRARGLLSCAV